MIAVSSLRENSHADWLSNYGPGIALTAIGEEVVYQHWEGYARIGGTGLAAAAVAGVAALLKAVDPFLTRNGARPGALRRGRGAPAHRGPGR